MQIAGHVDTTDQGTFAKSGKKYRTVTVTGATITVHVMEGRAGYTAIDNVNQGDLIALADKGFVFASDVTQLGKGL